MKPYFHWALGQFSSVRLDKMQLKDVGKNGLSVYFLQVFTIWQEKTNFMLRHRGSGQIKNNVCLLLLFCWAWPHSSAVFSLSSLRESHQWKTGLKKEGEECKRRQWRELWCYVEKCGRQTSMSWCGHEISHLIVSSKVEVKKQNVKCFVSVNTINRKHQWSSNVVVWNQLISSIDSLSIQSMMKAACPWLGQ